ncbi:helix-turn-helix domain-containing protein [Phaeovibrio sulfidiphilus]|uniref:Helix-turn-helix domain-containing protein n=1 Tax=Phaeovibrio sulfidiphilus TaxID=1220600 RepID=A0A8J6YUX5_9PROT|nr:helix-turn-helix domain-containing protein [Phaeovibrio sulfidiphilus]MBE1236207.1 helix-turn-helix domain-containing protein [Phaeovibrio sulfidiphilus]
MSEVTRRKYVGAVEQAVAILRCLSDHARPMGVSAVTRATGLNASTVFAILRTLAKERLVTFDEEGKTYAIGAGVLEFSVPLLGLNQTDLMRPSLETLAAELGAPVVLWQITKDERIVAIDRVRPPRVVAVEIQLGWRLPACAGAVGRCFAGQCYSGSESAMRERFDAIRWDRALSWEEFREDALDSVSRGYGIDRSFLFAGMNIVGTLVRDANLTPRFGLSVMTLVGQMSERSLEHTGGMLVALRDRIEKTVFGSRAGHPEGWSARTENGGGLPQAASLPETTKRLQDNFRNTGEHHERVLET